MNKILNLLKRIVLSYIILYGYNLIASQFNMVIPINVVTVTSVAFLGVPSSFLISGGSLWYNKHNS